MKCFYHSADLDGQCSGAIVKYRHPDCQTIGINYGEEYIIGAATLQYERIYLVDFTLQPWEKMIELDRGPASLVWIDHHKSSADEYQKQPLTNSTCKIEVGRAACELTWEFLFPDRPMPDSVRLLGRYDVWDLELQDVLPFQYGARLEDTHPDNTRFWSRMFNDELTDQILTNGRAALRYVQQENSKYLNDCAFETVLDGHHCIAINRMLTNSQMFDSAEGTHDIMLTFGWRSGQWTVSLYSTVVDVSEIAVAHGGGGHKGAAGFQCNQLPFELR